MRTLYHWPLDPDSRQARLALTEKKLKFTLETVSLWEPSEEFLSLCPEGLPPALLEDHASGKTLITTARAICEWAQDQSPTHDPIMPDMAADKAEARRICQWFDVKFMGDVNAYILSERLEKIVSGQGAPDPATLREGREHLAYHMDYLSWVMEDRDWLAGSQMSLADLAAGGHLSCLDYLGEIKWERWPAMKSWYQKLKSRPSFQPLLKDRIAGLMPPRHYADLDF